MAHIGLLSALFSVLLTAGDCRILPDSAFKHSDLAADACSECTGLLHKAHNMISGSQTKVMVYGALQSLCLNLPLAQASHCRTTVDSHLKKALLQPQSSVKSAESCALFGLCEPKEEQGPAAGAESQKEPFGPVCSLCVLVVKKLETLLPQNMTEDAIRALLAEVCSLIPQSYEEQCDEFVQKYGDEIVEFLMSSAAPHTLCTLLHLCVFSDSPAPQAFVPSDCDSCRTLSALSRIHSGLNQGLNQDLNQSESWSSAFLQSVCSLHPQAIPKCEAFIRVYSAQLLMVLGHRLGSPDACERAALCAPLTTVPLLGERRCTWGPSYWCRDMKTAQECGNQAFCKKFVWK